MAFEEYPPLCANGCGFFGNPATSDLCSKCYKDLTLGQMLKPLAIASRPKKHGEGPDPAGTQRCDCCNKRLRLASRFHCGCGSTSCTAHRYPEDRERRFDYDAERTADIFMEKRDRQKPRRGLGRGK